jgi:hypothetical protein
METRIKLYVDYKFEEYMGFLNEYDKRLEAIENVLLDAIRSQAS